MKGLPLALAVAESTKLRRTLGPWLVGVLPALAVVLTAIQLFSRDYPSGRLSWQPIVADGFALWLIFFMPMLILFEAASLANLEHDGKQWKQLFAFPVPRWTIYATKMVFCALLTGASLVAFALGFLGDVLLFSAFSGLHFSSSVPWLSIARIIAQAFVSSWLMIAIQTWLSVRVSGFAVPVGAGFAALVIGLMLSSIRGFVRDAIRLCYPWIIPLNTVSLSLRPDLGDLRKALPALIGSVGGVLFGAWACWDLARRREGD